MNERITRLSQKLTPDRDALFTQRFLDELKESIFTLHSLKCPSFPTISGCKIPSKLRKITLGNCFVITILTETTGSEKLEIPGFGVFSLSLGLLQQHFWDLDVFFLGVAFYCGMCVPNMISTKQMRRKSGEIYLPCHSESASGNNLQIFLGQSQCRGNSLGRHACRTKLPAKNF